MALGDDAEVLDKIAKGKELTDKEKEEVFILYRKWGPENGYLLKKVLNGVRLSRVERGRIKQLREDWLLSENDYRIKREIKERYKPAEYQISIINLARGIHRKKKGMFDISQSKGELEEWIVIIITSVIVGVCIISFSLARRYIISRIEARRMFMQFHEE